MLLTLGLSGVLAAIIACWIKIKPTTSRLRSVLFRGANILILDEPTAVLTPQETDKLFAVMRNMKNDGKSLIIITHNAKILEGLQVDYVHVLDDARIVRTGDGSLVNEIIEEGFTALKEDEAK